MKALSTESYCKALKRCYCITCHKFFHPLGIARHRAMHRDNHEDCSIIFSDGGREDYDFKVPDDRRSG